MITITVISIRTALDTVIPELQESEDEKMKDYIKDVIQAAIIPKKENKQKMIAWLEKQGQTFTKKDVDDAYLQGICNAKNEIEKLGKQKPTDKVEPKFHEDKWITNGEYTWKIVGVKSLDYILQSQDGNIVDDNISYVDKQFNLWTINDANDGDVLISTNTRNCPFIYRKTDYNNNLAYYYAGVNADGDFCEGCLKKTMYHFGPVADITPATKEQRDLLFQKMHEAGYEWNAEKKELKKIESKTLDADEVIEWIRENIPIYGNYVMIDKFKKDFG